MMNRILNIWRNWSRTGNQFFDNRWDISVNVLNNQLYLMFIIMSVFTIFAFFGHAIWANFYLLEDSDQLLLRTRYFLLPIVVLLVVLIISFKSKTSRRNIFIVNSVTFVASQSVTTYVAIWFGARTGFHLYQFVLLLLPIMHWRHFPNVLVFTGTFLSVVSIAFTHVAINNLPVKLSLAPSFYDFTYYSVIVAMVVSFIASVYYLAEGSFRAQGLLLQEKANSEYLLKEIIPELERSRKKYRHLVEDTPEIIMSLSPKGRILHVNRAVDPATRFTPQEMHDKQLADYLFASRWVEQDRERLRTALNAAMNGNKQFLTLPFRHKYMPEPIEMEVRLDYTETDGEAEILGKLTPLHENVVVLNLRKEKRVYMVDNNLTNTDHLTSRLTEHLGSRVPPSEVAGIRVSLREALINAIEHGNLGITFEEKTSSQQAEKYVELIRERQSDPKFRDRRVMVEYALMSDYAVWRITDGGNGFDHAAVMDKIDATVNAELLSHGRGLQMLRYIFDRVKFNSKGNSVTLVKYFRRR